LAFDDHADVDALRAYASSRRGSQAARRHLAAATTSLEEYFSGELPCPTCNIDWEQLESNAPTLMTTQTIAYGSHRSYSALAQSLAARDLGHLLGRNPIPLFMPCHRVRRGAEIPNSFVGGLPRREWLEAHEQTHRLD
jgi:methylated-DNA-[protein]-cysteine S-methyltransferase